MLSLIGLGGFTLASLVIGVRLALLARRNRAWPEATLAVAFLCAGALGNTMNAVVAMGLVPEASCDALRLAARVLGITGSCALYLFSWRVFRPEARWAAALALAGIASGIGTWVGYGLAASFGAELHDLGWYWGILTSRAAGYGWAGVESLLYWRAMRRRQRLGLAERSTTDRFLFWGVGSSAAFAIFVVNMAYTAFTGVVGISQALRDVTSCLGLVAALAIWMAFFPPAFYRRWAASSSA